MLAGGGSVRFGEPKGLVSVAGVRVIDRVATVLREVADELLLVANDARARDWLPMVRNVADVHPGHGPLSGIHAALAATGSAVLAVAWDMPFVSAALLRELRRRGEGDPALAIVPESEAGQLEPACALYGAGCREPIAAWLDGGGSGATAFLERFAGTRRVPVADVARIGQPDRLFFSIDTRDALATAERMATSLDRAAH